MSMSKLRLKAKGFTLIELVVVIVILGILAATAAPKFMNLQSEAKIAKLKGLAGALRSAVSMGHAKAMVRPDLNYICVANNADDDSCPSQYQVPLTANRYPNKAIVKSIVSCSMACDSSLRFCDPPVGCTDKKDVEIATTNNLDNETGVITILLVPYSYALQSGSNEEALARARKCGIQYKYTELPSYEQILPKVELVTDGC
jgi:prepilin-type N-terminal cleavage/methylation domain-containing protein